MPTLRESQQSFAAALLDGVCAPINAFLRNDGADSGARIGIYRQQLYAVFVRALALEFPVVERLVGSECFQRLGRDFQSAHPSRAGNLHHIGGPFAGFLKERFSAGAYEYLADVAALEWALLETLVAPEAPAFDPRALRNVAPADYAQLHFELHPACRLVHSRYPTLDIWLANQDGASATQIIDLASGGTRVLVQRSSAVGFHRLSAPEFALLNALGRDCSLGAALDAAQRSDAAFDLAAALRRCVALKAFTTAKTIK